VPKTIILVIAVLRSDFFRQDFPVHAREHEHCDEQQYRADPLSDVQAEVGACGLIAGDEVRVYKYRGERKAEAPEGDRRYLHRGIASRSFERRFQLADHVEVKGADLKDGLLNIDLVRNIPERMRRPNRGGIASTPFCSWSR